MIRIENLHKNFNSNAVLKGVNLEIEEGKTLTIIGKSGCGKTVLLKHIIGLLKPDAGEIEIDGVEITRLKDSELGKIQRKFGVLFQGAALFDSLSVGENVAFGLYRLTDLTPEQIRSRVIERLAMVGLEGVENLMTPELSGGMKKRVALARAIATDPKYIIYDEPTTGVDPVMGDVINNLIIQLQKTLRITSITVTHDINSACKISDRIGMLADGRIIVSGSPREIRASADPVVRQFMASSREG